MIYPVSQVSLLQCLGVTYEQVNSKRKMVLNLDKDRSVADTQNQTGAETDTIDDNPNTDTDGDDPARAQQKTKVSGMKCPRHEISESENESENEGYSDEDDIDAIINDKIDTNHPGSPPPQNLSLSRIVSTAQDIICQDYVVKELVYYLDPVSQVLADTVTDWCRTPAKREEVRNQFKVCMLPQNVEGLRPIRINEMLYRKLPTKAKVNDQRLGGINTFLSRGMGPIV